MPTIGVAGAGTMGLGIARASAEAGFKTLLFDISPDLVARAINSLTKDLERAVDNGKMTRDRLQQIVNNIVACHSLKDLKGDLIIEAVVENLEVKREFLVRVESVNSTAAILATNTSSLSVTLIGSALKNPGRFVGIHFFNPAHIMKLVEVVGSAASDPQAVQGAVEFIKKLGKTPVVAKDSPGFIVNRVARPYYVESLRLLEEDACEVTGIDRLLRSAGFRMGPFELMDLIGLDINYSVTSSLYEAYHQEPRFKPSRIQKEKIDKGYLGRKTGKGFYEYEKK